MGNSSIELAASGEHRMKTSVLVGVMVGVCVGVSVDVGGGSVDVLVALGVAVWVALCVGLGVTRLSVRIWSVAVWVAWRFVAIPESPPAVCLPGALPPPIGLALQALALQVHSRNAARNARIIR